MFSKTSKTHEIRINAGSTSLNYGMVKSMESIPKFIFSLHAQRVSRPCTNVYERGDAAGRKGHRFSRGCSLSTAHLAIEFEYVVAARQDPWELPVVPYPCMVTGCADSSLRRRVFLHSTGQFPL